MATLTAEISATERTIRVTDPGTPRLEAIYRIGDELVRLTGLPDGAYGETDGVWAWTPDPATWSVDRGVEGTVAASHLADAAVTEFDVTAGGSGAALTVTDGSTSVEDVGSILLTGATVTDDGGGAVTVGITGGSFSAEDLQFTAGAVPLSIALSATTDGDVATTTIKAENLDDGGYAQMTFGSTDGISLETAASLSINAVGVSIYNLPSSDPEVAGQLFTDGAPGAGAPVALKISGGPA